MSLVHPILEYGAAYWDLFRKGKINALDWVRKKEAKFAKILPMNRSGKHWRSVER